MKSRNYRVLRNKETGALAKDFAHWVGGQHVYLPTNDQWEVVDQNSEWDDFVQKVSTRFDPCIEKNA